MFILSVYTQGIITCGTEKVAVAPLQDAESLILSKCDFSVTKRFSAVEKTCSALQLCYAAYGLLSAPKSHFLGELN